MQNYSQTCCLLRLKPIIVLPSLLISCEQLLFLLQFKQIVLFNENLHYLLFFPICFKLLNLELQFSFWEGCVCYTCITISRSCCPPWHMFLVDLQEVETEQYYNFFLPELKEQGYDGFFSPKSRARTMSESDRKHVDGCAIFYKTEKYVLLLNFCGYDLYFLFMSRNRT